MNRKTSTPKSSKLSVQKLEQKVTHRFFQDKYLKVIPKLIDPDHLVVLYLHNNEIEQISHLQYAANLNSLYLQNNHICKIENLKNLKKLKKLFLGHNAISVVEGLDNAHQLEELYLERQSLPEGNSLCFDPRTVFKISNTLKILDICHNRIQSISSLEPLNVLRAFYASHNDLSDLDEVCSVIRNWINIKEVSFANNPIAKNRLYKEEIISSIYRLESLDGKEVTEYSRDFLKRLHRDRVTNNLRSTTTEEELLPDVSHNYPMSIQRAVSLNLMKNKEQFNENMEIFDEDKGVFIPWNTLPKAQPPPKLQCEATSQRKLLKKQTITKSIVQFTHIQL